MKKNPIIETELIEMARDVLAQHPEILTYRHFMNLMSNKLRYRTVDYELKENVCRWVYWGEVDKELIALKLKYGLAKLKRRFKHEK